MNIKYIYTYKSTSFLFLKQKHHWPSLMSTFSSSLQGPFLVMFPVDLFCFFKRQDIDSSSYSFMVMYDKDWGYVLSSEPQTLRQCLNFIDVILQIPICYRRRKRKRNTSIKIHVLVHFSITSQFYVHVNDELFFHVYINEKYFLQN